MLSLNRPDETRPARGAGFLLAAAILALTASCDDVVIAPVDVAQIQVLPEEAQVGVGDDVQLSAELHDAEGRPLTGHAVAWSSDDEAVATVNGSGRVSGAGGGTTRVRARVGNVEGSALIRVLSPPVIVLSRNAVEFAVDSGGPPAPAIEIDITNGGETALTGLALDVEYGSGASGWLSASLSQTSAPATLALGISDLDLRPGTYDAIVHVSASSAPGDAVPVAVALEVREVLIIAEIPPPPANLAVELLDPARARLTWNAQGTDLEEFRIQRRVSSGSFQDHATVEGGTTQYVDENLEADTRYTYRVRACNVAGCSDHSDEAFTETAPPAPLSLHVSMLRSNRVRIAWTYNGSTQATLHIQRARGGGSSPFSELATVASDVTFYDDRDVDDETTYRYRMYACNLTGCSGMSNTITVTTPDD